MQKSQIIYAAMVIQQQAEILREIAMKEEEGEFEGTSLIVIVNKLEKIVEDLL